MVPSINLTIQQERAQVPLTIFRFEGELDANTYRPLQDAATDACQYGMRWLLMDMSETKYMSSAGLRALHFIDNLLRQTAAGAEEGAGSSKLVNNSFKSPFMKLLNPSPAVAHTLKISGFEMVFDIFFDRQLAIDSF